MFLNRVTGSVVLWVWVMGMSIGAAAEERGRFETAESLEATLSKQISGKRSPVTLDATVEMICPPPGAGLTPPCTLPVGIDPDLVAPDPSGELRVLAFADDSALAWIKLDGLSRDLVVTAWLVYVPPGAPPPAPIFEPIGPGLPPVAAPSAPLAPTYARFSEGMGWEPNRLQIFSSGKAHLFTWLDYNPLKAGQAPLRNGMVSTQQGLAPADSPAVQPLCCPDAVIPPAPGPRLSPIGSSFLRRFDPDTGFQVLDLDGRPELVRSPVAVPLIVVIVHLDRMTHGIHPGIVIPPFPGAGFPATAGDHYVLGIFPIGGLAMD